MKKVLYPDLVAEMAKRGETQKTIAKLIGIANTNVSKRFSGKKDWSISEIEKICDYYGKSYDELFKKK